MQVLLQPTTLIDEADKELQSFTLKGIGQISPISRSLCFEAHESDWSRYYKQSVYETQCWTPEARTDGCPRSSTVDDSCGNGFEKAAAKAKKATFPFLTNIKPLQILWNPSTPLWTKERPDLREEPKPAVSRPGSFNSFYLNYVFSYVFRLCYFISSFRSRFALTSEWSWFGHVRISLSSRTCYSVVVCWWYQTDWWLLRYHIADQVSPSSIICYEGADAP